MDLNSIVPIVSSHNPNKPTFTCRFCKHVFVSESRYTTHECKQMKRAQEFKTPMGQAAWGYYQAWYKYLKKPAPSGNVFVSSNYFRTFINFAKFVKSVDLPFPDKFIWFATDNKFTPSMWTLDAVYVKYIDYVDTSIDPMLLVKKTVAFLVTIAVKHDVDPSQVFTVIDPYDLIHWVRIRKITPWVLLHSTTFKKYFVHDTNHEQQQIFETLLRPEYWSEQFLAQPGVVTQVKEYLKILNL